MKAERPRVIVIGCGFGGIEAVRALSKAAVEITVVDRTNHHLFQPLLYQVATAGLSAPAVSAPIRHALRKEMRRGNLTILQGEVTAIDAVRRRVVLDRSDEADAADTLAYDHLIVASGSTHSYFGHPDWEAHAPGLKTLADAFAIRAKVIGAFEQAERCTDPAAREPARAAEQLARLGVDLRTGCKVTGIDADGVTYETRDGAATASHRLAAKTVIWAAGVAATPLGRSLGAATGATVDRAGRVVVEPDLSLPDHPEIAVIGDLAAALSHGPGEPKPVPGVSPGAKQMGRTAAKNLLRRLRGEPTQAFRYIDYGNLATVGRKAAVVDLGVPGFGALRFSGLLAWLFWLFAHIYFLIGFRNRLTVMVDWAWAYVTYERSARVVAQPPAASRKTAS